MPDRFYDILTVIQVAEDFTLQALRDDILDLCSHAGGPDQAIQRLTRCVEKTTDHFNLVRIPWYQIYMAYAYSNKPNLPSSLQCALLSVDGFDQIDHVWNRAITRWFCAVLYKKAGDNEEAALFFEEAIRLMRREIGDLKRRSFYQIANQSETVLGLLLADAALPLDGPGLSSPSAELPEYELYCNLRTKVSGNDETAERLIENQRSNRPDLTRKECIIRAIEAWEHDNR